MCSFHATKVFNTIEGGMISTKNSSLIEKIEILKNYGITSPETIDEIGTNGKMSEFQAAMGVASWKYCDKIINRRKELTMQYKEKLSNIQGIKLCEEKDNITYNYAYMPILLNEKYGISRNELYDRLKEHGVYSRKYFYPLTNMVSCYKNKYVDANIPNATYVANHILTLPLYLDLKDEEVELITKIIKNRGK